MATIADNVTNSTPAESTGFDMKDPNSVGINGNRILTELDYNKLVAMIGKAGATAAPLTSNTATITPTAQNVDINYVPCREEFLKWLQSDTGLRADVPKLGITNSVLKEVPYEFTIAEKDYLPVSSSETDRYATIKKTFNKYIKISYGSYLVKGELWKEPSQIILPGNVVVNIPRKITLADVSNIFSSNKVFDLVYAPQFSEYLNKSTKTYLSYQKSGVLKSNWNGHEYTSTDLTNDYMFIENGDIENVNPDIMLQIRRYPQYALTSFKKEQTSDGEWYWKVTTQFRSQFDASSPTEETTIVLLTPTEEFQKMVVSNYNYLIHDQFNTVLKSALGKYETEAKDKIKTYMTTYNTCYDNLNKTENINAYNAFLPGYNSDGTLNNDEKVIKYSLVSTPASNYTPPVACRTNLKSYMDSNHNHSTYQFFVEYSTAGKYLTNISGVNYLIDQTVVGERIIKKVSPRTFDLIKNSQSTKLLIFNYIDLSDVVNDHIIFKATYPEPWYILHKSNSTPDISFQELNSMVSFFDYMLNTYLSNKFPPSTTISNRYFKYGYSCFYNLDGLGNYQIENIDTNPINELNLISPQFILYSNIDEKLLYYKTYKDFAIQNSSNVLVPYNNVKNVIPILDSELYSVVEDKNYIYYDRQNSIEKVMNDNRSIVDMLRDVATYLHSNKTLYFGNKYSPATYNDIPKENFHIYCFADLLRVNFTASLNILSKIATTPIDGVQVIILAGITNLGNIGTTYSAILKNTAGVIFSDNYVPTPEDYGKELLDGRMDSDFSSDLHLISDATNKPNADTTILLKVIIKNLIMNETDFVFYIRGGTTSYGYEKNLFNYVHGTSTENVYSTITSIEEYKAIINFYRNNTDNFSNVVVSGVKIDDLFNSDGSSKGNYSSTFAHKNYILKSKKIDASGLVHAIKEDGYFLIFNKNYIDQLNVSSIKSTNVSSLVNFYIAEPSSRICYSIDITDTLDGFEQLIVLRYTTIKEKTVAQWTKKLINFIYQ